jgi:hypothetical protein
VYAFLPESLDLRCTYPDINRYRNAYVAWVPHPSYEADDRFWGRFSPYALEVNTEGRCFFNGYGHYVEKFLQLLLCPYFDRITRELFANGDDDAHMIYPDTENTKCEHFINIADEVCVGTQLFVRLIHHNDITTALNCFHS